MEENPYARAAGPTPAAPGSPETPREEQKENDYATAVGKNTDYFLPKFEQFDNGGSRVGWNWPAFFLTGPYFLYRKMWLAGFLYLFYPAMLALPLGIAAAVMPKSAAAIVTVGALLYLASWIVLPLYANAIYWSKINKLIDNLPRNIANQPEKRQRRLDNNGGTNVVVPLVIYLFGGFGWIGMVAAISIPAYQDYTIRSQVSHGLYYASDAKSAVVDFRSRNNAWPENNAAAGFSGGTSKYVEAVEIDRGTVIVAFGAEVNPQLKGGRIALVPGLNEGGGVVWVCGDGPTPDGVTLSEGPRGVEIDTKYLPANCRGP